MSEATVCDQDKQSIWTKKILLNMKIFNFPINLRSLLHVIKKKPKCSKITCIPTVMYSRKK